MARIEDVLSDLRSLDEESSKGGVSRVYVEVRDTGAREVAVRANREGLIALAAQLVALAVKPTSGKHAHIDEASIADHCDRDLVLVYVPAPWD